MYNNMEMLLRDIKDQQTALFIGAGAARCDFKSHRQLPDGSEMKLELYKHRYGDIPNTTLKNYESKFRDEFNIKRNVYIPPELVWEKCLSKTGEELTQ